MKRLALTILSACFVLGPQGLSSDDVELLLKDIELELVDSGEFRIILEPHNRTLLSAQVETTVASVNFKLGEEFFEDDLLIQLRDRTFAATYEKTRALLAKADKELEVRQELRADNVASELEVAEAEANQVVANADFIIAKEQLNSCSVLAPYQGKVVTIHVEEHELVRPGQPLAELVNDNLLTAKFLVPSVRLTEMQIDREIELYIAEADLAVTAVIKRVGAVIDPASSMAKVEAEVDNSQNLLKAGMVGITRINNAEQPSEGESE